MSASQEPPYRRRLNGDLLLWSEARERQHGYAMAVGADGYEYACGLDESERREGGDLVREWTMHGRRERFVQDGETKRWRQVSVAPADAEGAAVEVDSDRRAFSAWWRKFRRNWRQNGNVVLRGPTGTGKTFAADVALRFVAATGTDCERLKWTAFVQALSESYFTDDEPRRRWRELRERCAAVPFLAVDDFAASKPTPALQDAWTAVLDARIEADLPTLITTNASEAELSAAGWDGRVLSRLALWESLGMGSRDWRRHRRPQEDRQ